MDQSEIDATLAATYSLKRTHSWPPSQWYLDRFAEDPELPVTAFQELSQDINEARQSLTAPVEPSSIDRGCSRLAEKPSGSDWSESSRFGSGQSSKRSSEEGLFSREQNQEMVSRHVEDFKENGETSFPENEQGPGDLEELHMPFLFSIPSPPRFRESSVEDFLRTGSALERQFTYAIHGRSLDIPRRDLLDLYGGIQAAAGMPHQIRKRHANGRRKASKEPDRNLHDIREESNASQIFRDEEAARIRENAQRASRSCLFLRELLLYKDEMPTLKEALEEFPTDHTMPRHEHPGLISEFVNSYSAIGTKEEDEAMPKHYEHFPKWARDFTRNSELRRKANSQSANGGDASANGGEQQSGT
ncbi:MAG: hypothetical protein Q9162_001999 [Coniocarpon cinnabarinum]